MKSYLTIDSVEAEQMNRASFHKLFDQSVPAGYSASDIGYLVNYKNTTSNTSIYNGYVTWMPEEVFKQAYKDNTSVSVV